MDANDQLAIHQLLSQYGHLVDDHDWDGFAELFTPDAVLDYTAVRAPNVCHGIDEILQYFRTGNHPSAHHVLNVVVSEVAVDGGHEVRVHSKFLVPFTRPSHSPQRWYGGDYRDVVVKVSAGWRFATRVCTPRWQLSAESGEELPLHRRSF
jgi:3-phenylpropionate/cinnamic acid dioxygenase small subunit